MLLCVCVCCAPSCYAVFCVIYSLLMFVSDATGDHIVETYSSMDLVMAWYVARIISFCFPHVVDVSALSIYIVLRTFVVVISMCLLYVSLGSRVSPSIFGLIFMGSVMLSICSSSCVLYSAGSGVKSTVHHSETTLPRATCRTLAQLRTNKYPILHSYLNKINDVKHPSPLCPLCKTEPHTTTHLFNCTNINTQLQVTDLWTSPVEVGHLLVEWSGPPVNWRSRIPVRWGIPSAGVRRNGCCTPPPFFG